MLLSIVIVNYYSKHLMATIKNIQAHCPYSKQNYEIIIIDNASEMSLQKYAEEHNILYLVNKKNIGFGAAMNKGIQHSSGVYIALLNPDILISKETFPLLITYLKKNKSVGLVGPKLLNKDGKLQYSCKRFPDMLTLVARRMFMGSFIPFLKKRCQRYEMQDVDHESIQQVDWLSGAFLMGKKEIFKEYQFDEQFFLYFEDVDLCRRIGYKYPITYYPHAVATHYAEHGSKKSLNLFFYHLSSMFKYFKKYGFS